MSSKFWFVFKIRFQWHYFMYLRILKSDHWFRDFTLSRLYHLPSRRLKAVVPCNCLLGQIKSQIHLPAKLVGTSVIMMMMMYGPLNKTHDTLAVPTSNETPEMICQTCSPHLRRIGQLVSQKPSRQGLMSPRLTWLANYSIHAMFLYICDKIL